MARGGVMRSILEQNSGAAGKGLKPRGILYSLGTARAERKIVGFLVVFCTRRGVLSLCFCSVNRVL